jgi:Porin subfamily
MKMVKSLILGSAAALVAMSGAQAADLPVKAKAVEYVRVCSLYGAGFFYIPGSDTCIKLGGYLRVDTTINGANHGQPAWSGDLGQGNRFADMFASRSRFALTVDTRTATEYGVVRTFAQGDFTFNNFGNTNPASLSSSATPTALAGISGNLLNGVAGGYVNVEFAFIQFAGFTFGKSASAFSTPWNGFPGNNTSYLLGGNDTSTGVNNIQYTAQFGNGVSGTIGLDDPTVYNRTALYNLAAGSTSAALTTSSIGASGLGVNAYGGLVVPDLVGNVRVDQAWGLFQLSGVLHSVNASYNALGATGAPVATGSTIFNDSVLSGHPDSKVGGAIMAALQIKNLPTGPGDDIKFDTTWSKGDTKEVISAAATSPNFLMIGGVPGQFGPSGTIGIGATTDGVFLPTAYGGDGSIHLTTAYGLRGAFNHNWDPYWSTSLFGGAGWVKYDNTAKGYYCSAFGLTHPGLGVSYACDPNYSIGQIGLITRWTPVKNLTFSAETMYTMLHQNFSGTSTFSPGGAQPVQAWTFHDQSTVQVELRVQRNF